MKDALDRAKASLRLEGMEATREEEELVLRRARGEITEDEFTRLVLELAQKPLAPAKA